MHGPLNVKKGHFIYVFDCVSLTKVCPGGGHRFFSSAERPDRLWFTPSILFNGPQGLLRRRWSGRGLRLTAYVRLVSRFAMSGTVLPLPPHALVYILTGLAVTSTFT